MAFNEKEFLSTLQSKIADGEAEWIAGIPGQCNPPTLYTVSLGDYRADVVQVFVPSEDPEIPATTEYMLWCYDSQDRLAEIVLDHKFLDAISVAEAPAEKEAMTETVDITAKKEAMAVAVASYSKPMLQEEGLVESNNIRKES